MDDENVYDALEDYFRRETDIPEIFKTEEGTYFKSCISCDVNVMETGEPYMIEKAIKRYSNMDGVEAVIFEYAICTRCAEKMRKSLSKESMQRLEKHFLEKANWDKKMELFNQEKQPVVNDFLGDCIFTGQSIDDENINEYQVVGYFQGDKLRLDRMPFMMCGAAADEIGELLSAKTKDELDGFIDDNFGLPPEWKKALKERDFIPV